MSSKIFANLSRCMRLSYTRRFQAGVVALLLALALPALAADRAVKSRVPPAYPEIAKRMKIAGAVKLKVTVDAGGTVTDVKAIDGNRMLTPAAEDAVRKWKFETGEGAATMEVEVRFALAS